MSEQTIHEAARVGNIARMSELIGADPTLVDALDEEGLRPLCHAAMTRRKPAVELLIDSGADLAADRGAALDYAARVSDNKEIVRLLMLHGAFEPYAGPIDDELRQFFAAVLLASERRVEAMLERRPDPVGARDGRGFTALHRAARHGDAGIVRILIRCGADINALSGDGENALAQAVRHGHFPVVELLLFHGVDTSVLLPNGQTILNWARAHAAGDPAVRAIIWAIEDYENEQG